jgi:hypothetical protein
MPLQRKQSGGRSRDSASEEHFVHPLSCGHIFRIRYNNDHCPYHFPVRNGDNFFILAVGVCLRKDGYRAYGKAFSVFEACNKDDAIFKGSSYPQGTTAGCSPSKKAFQTIKASLDDP